MPLRTAAGPVGTVDPRLHQQLPNTHRRVWLSLLWSHCSFLLGPGAHKFLLGPPSVSVSPVLWKFNNQILLTFRVTFRGDSQSLCGIPRLGSLLWGLEFSQQCKNFFGIIVLQFVDRPPRSSIVWLMATSSRRTNATCCAFQDCCCQSPSPHSGPPLTHASSGDPQTFTGSSGSVSCGGHCSFPWVPVRPLSSSGWHNVWF